MHNCRYCTIKWDCKWSLKILVIEVSSFKRPIRAGVSLPLAEEENRPSVRNFMFSTNQTKTNSLSLSSRANYTDWATATCRRNIVPAFVDRGVSRGQRGGSPTVVNLSFLHVYKSVRWTKSIHPLIPSIIHHSQNPIEYTNRQNQISFMFFKWTASKRHP
jgi:hypothetical protein